MKHITNIQIIFYSMYGHIYRMAEAVADGVKMVEGTDVAIYQVPEIVPQNILEKIGAAKAREVFAHIPVASVEQLSEADAIIFGTPTRFGNMCAQMRNFLDQTGGLWAKGALVGKVGSVFTSTGTGGGNETTITSFWNTLAHHGFIIVGLPYAAKELLDISEMRGGRPYGAATVAGPDGTRRPNPQELAMARFQGRHVAQITKALVAGRQA